MRKFDLKELMDNLIRAEKINFIPGLVEALAERFEKAVDKMEAKMSGKK